MAKRFTDTDLWDKQWFMELGMKHKLLIKFLFAKCDVAGVWSPNWVLASSYIGAKIERSDLDLLKKHVEILPDGRVFVLDFISFQYGVLTEKCMPHRKIIALLKKYELFERVSVGYRKGIDTLQEEEEYKEEEKDKDKEEEKEEKPKRDRKIHFEQSEVYDPVKFELAFFNTDYAVCDLRYYYEAVKTWSENKREKRIDWIATARSFIISDKKENKVVFKNSLPNGQGNTNGKPATGGNVVYTQSTDDKLNAYGEQFAKRGSTGAG